MRTAAAAPAVRVNGADGPVASLDAELCYRALLSRDDRFDGRFFIGVKTTGVYCRPICPARTPKKQNVHFYPCAAAAAEAGFRPCLRCRPETSPGTPAWLGTSATVSRALRHIGAGALDDDNVETLAARLGIGDRHLRRLFMEHLGATPVAVAQTRRIHFAKKLIDETELPMTRVALDAGFSSIRRFNAAIKSTYGKNPSELRRRRTTSATKQDSLTLRLPFREPFDWDLLLEFFAMRAIPGVESVSEGAYRRTVRVGDKAGVLTIRRAEDKPHLLLEVPMAVSRGLVNVVERIRRVFDLGADPAEIDARLRRERHLAARIKRRPGVRVPGAWDGFEMAVRGIVGQQVTVRGATTIVGRIVERYGTPLGEPNGDGLTHAFPTPEVLAEADLSKVGMPRLRGRTINTLAAAVVAGSVSLSESAGLEESVTRLCELPGIGAWTAEYIAMRALGEPDAFPASDVGVLRALDNGNGRLSPRAATELAEAWRPWRAYAVLYLWTIDAGAPRARNGKRR